LITADEQLRASNQKIAQNKINYQPVVSEQDDITAKNPILRLICNKKPTEQALTPLAGKRHDGRSDKGCLLGTATWCIKGERRFAAHVKNTPPHSQH